MSQEAVSYQKAPVLEFDHNVIEHLGIRLYQNKPGSVMAEIVANCWDADAQHVYITASPFEAASEDRFLSVADDGCGMDFEAIRTRYLKIGKPKRNAPKMKSAGGRSPMGRKGIGKLAPFGIARSVDVVTCANDKISWFTLDLDELIAAGRKHGAYPPKFTVENADLSAELPAEAPGDIVQFAARVRSSAGKTGTLVRLGRFTANRDFDATDIEKSLASKFTVVLNRPDFEVTINGEPIDKAKAIPGFDLRIPESGFLTETIGPGEVKFWVGFVGSAEWAADEAGVGVFAHGKSAQDRPFFFGAKGKEIFQRYMYGTVEADWLDELDKDLISTDRSSLDWGSDELADFREWGRAKVGSWLGAYAAHRGRRHVAEVKARAAGRRASKAIPAYSSFENDQIDQLVADATRDLGRNQTDVADELHAAVSKAWVNLPTRTLLKDLWSGIWTASSGSAAFLDVTSKLHDHSVPEAMGLAMTFAQRAYALSLLHQLVHQKSEENLQELIEGFPWIIQPRGDLLTSDKHLKTTIEHAALNDSTKDRAGREIKGMSERERADFVFLTDASKKAIQIVELKAPARELTAEHDRQLRDYLDFTKAYHPTAKLTGLLIGNPGHPAIQTTDTRITVRGWDEILLECRAMYIDLIASMLERADPAASDARMKLVMEFGGESVWQLLQNIATKDEALAELMERFRHLKEGDSAAIPDVDLLQISAAS